MNQWIRTIVVLLGLHGLSITHAQSIDPERQLAAIRQALVDAVLDKPTKVNASAWIDGQGRLRETSHFQTDAQIRGVRVLSYGQNQDQVQAQVDLQDMPWSVRVARAQPGQACVAPPQNWRQPLLVQSSLAPGFHGPELFAADALLKETTATWRELAAQSNRWSVDQPGVAANDAYTQAWLGQGPEPLGWQIQITLHPRVHAQAEGQFTAAWYDVWSNRPTQTWMLTVTFGQKSSPGSAFVPHWQQSMAVHSTLEDISSKPRLWAQRVLGQFTPWFAQWMKMDDAEGRCEPVRFSVNRQNGSVWVAQAGSHSGLKVGDRVLVVNSTRIPGQVFEPGTTHQMAIAEVLRVGRRQSELRMIAGTPTPGPGDWVALPL